MVLHVDVHPLNSAFDSSKINGSSFNVKGQQIDANKLQRYLSSSGFFGSYYRKYDFMYFHALILFDNIYLFLLNLAPTQADIGQNVARFVPFWARQRNGKSRAGD